MLKSRLRLLGAMLAFGTLSIAAQASEIAVGYISFDVTGLNVAEFDIGNLTGPNASTFPDMTFPITTPVSLTDLSLTVDFAGGASEVFGPSYFTLAGDGLSFNGEQLSTLSTYPTGLFGASEAILTGEFSIPSQFLTLNDGTMGGLITPGFSVTITDPSGLLSDGDLGIINASATPEPATWTMLGPGLIGLMGMAGATRRKLLAKLRKSGIALSLGLAMLLLPAAMKAQVVKLSADTVPSLGSSGTSTVSVTGTGFPAAPIPAADVTVTLSTTCGGAPVGGDAAVSSVTNILGSSEKIEFVIPGSLAAGNYYVSVSGTNESSVAFSSGNCSLVNVVAGPSPTLTINTSNATDWVINNGVFRIDFNSTGGAVWSIIPNGTTDQLVDFSPGDADIPGTTTEYDPADGESAIGGTAIPAGWPGTSGIPGLAATTFNKEPKGFYMDLSGFSSTATTGHYILTDSYLDFWTDYTGAGVTYDEHFVVTPNDSGIHIYFTMNNLAGNGSTDGAQSVGQVQWIWRDNVYEFTNLYNEWADLSMSSPVITELPSFNDCFAFPPGRNVEDNAGYDTIDLHPDINTGPGTGVYNGFNAEQEVGGMYPNPNASTMGQVPPGFHRNFCVKYDYSSYEYIHPAHGLFGPKYGIWAVFTPGHDTFVAGPGKQNLDFTGGILTIEAMSDHYQTGDVTISYTAGQVLQPTLTGTTTQQHQRIFGPFYVRINQFGGDILTPQDMYNDALTAGASFTNFYNNETELLNSGYIPTTTRGSVSVQVNGVAGVPRTAWAVLSQPGVNQISSVKSDQYVLDISATGTGTFTNVVPGTYRLSVYDFGQFGEYRNDSIVVAANQTTTVPTITFQPENFGTSLGTIGSPDRSSHEFLHGANTENYPDQPMGFDDREYYGNWNFWADFASTNGLVTYNLTSGPNGPATNNPLAWNYAHWGAYNPALYAGAYSATDVSTDAYETYPGHPGTVPSYVATLTGHSGTNGATTPLPPWQIHFATPAAGVGSNQYAILTLALSASQGKETVTLNGTAALSYTPSASFNSDAIERSGLSGYYQLVVFQWPISDLKAAGLDNVITTSTSGTNSQDSDDALRVSLSVTSSQPSVTGWHDYTFVAAAGAGTNTAVNDAVPNP